MSWIKNAFFYHIYQLVFFAGPQKIFLPMDGDRNTPVGLSMSSSRGKVRMAILSATSAGKAILTWLMVDNKSRLMIRDQRVEINIPPCWAMILLVKK